MDAAALLGMGTTDVLGRLATSIFKLEAFAPTFSVHPTKAYFVS